MGRKKRIWVPDCFYHVICRGNRRDPLFQNAGDFNSFLQILDSVYDVAPFELAAYCLMTNHYHLQLRSMEQHVSKVMSLINKRYANYYNTRFALTGHVFEKRYYGEIIDSHQGMLKVSRYIHLNPMEAKMVRLPGDYPWSSYKYYEREDLETPRFMNPKALLDCFPASHMDKRLQYSGYIHAEKSDAVLWSVL